MLDELKKLPQWVCSKIVMRDGKATKPPFQINGDRASVTDPATWSTYDACKASGAQFVGFVLTKEDPFCIIDLDPPNTPEQKLRHKAILEKFDTYTERSQSGNGYHLIMRGEVPKGFRRDQVEVYSSERFMVTTENPTKDKAVETRQDLLDILYHEMSNHGVVRELIDGLEVASDGEILEIAHRAANGAKFSQLYKGDQTGYPSQSEADYALLSLLCFYSRNTDQVIRIFRTSELGQRKKAQRDKYLLDAIAKIRSNEPPPVDLSKIDLPKEVATEEPSKKEALEFPPGLVGQLALYIYQSAVRPVPEVGLSGAIALCAGLWGRAYNISNTGLNQYVILLGKTGMGKDGALSGIERVLSQLRPEIQAIDSKIGPAGFASGQAVLKALETQQSFLSVLGEFGLTLQQMCDTNAGSHLLALRKVLLDLYSRSGHGSYLRPHAYADSSKNTLSVESPAVSLLGEGTPESFFAGITEDHIAEGLIPRFTIIEYDGKRPRSNLNKFYKPDRALVSGLVATTTNALVLESDRQVCHVGMDLAAMEILDEFDVYADDKINSSNADVVAQLWNRAHLKALKLSALVAVGVDGGRPEVTTAIAQWAINFVKNEIKTFLAKFTVEKLDSDEIKQEGELLKHFAAYTRMSPQDRARFRISKKLVEQKNIVPYSFLRRKLSRIACFKKDRRSIDLVIDKLLDHLLKEDRIQELSQEQQNMFKTKQRLFVCGEDF